MFDTPTYQQKYGPRYNTRTTILCNWINSLSKGRVLDIGCGRGLLSLQLRELGYSVTLLDKNSTMIEVSRELFGNYGYEAEFVQSDLFHYYPQMKFDVVVCCELLEHIDDVKALRYICENILKKNGYLVLSVPASKIAKQLSSDPRGHQRIYNKELLNQRLISAGYETERIRYYGGIIMAIYFKYFNKRIRDKGYEKGAVLESRTFNLYKILAGILIKVFRVDDLIFGGRIPDVGLVAIAQT